MPHCWYSLCCAILDAVVLLSAVGGTLVRPWIIWSWGRFSKAPETFRARKAIAKSRTLQSQSCFIHIFLRWREIPFTQGVSGVYTSPFLDTDDLKMALRAWKLSGAFEKRAPGLWPKTLRCVLGRDTLLSQCLSPPRCINGYWWLVGTTWQNTWKYPAMN